MSKKIRPKKKSTIYPIDASPAATKPLDLPCLKDREQVGPSAAALLLPLTLEYHPDLNFSLKILNYISFKTFFFPLTPQNNCTSCFSNSFTALYPRGSRRCSLDRCKYRPHVAELRAAGKIRTK